MKLGSFTRILSTIAIALGSTATLVQPGYTQSSKFYCGMSSGVPATLVRTSRGNIPVIRWVDNAFPPPWTPQQRCEEISARFQRFYDNGTLNFLRAGKLSNQPVLCVASYKGGSCLPNGVLVTLKVGTNAPLTLQRLLDRQGSGGGRPINLSGGDSKELFSYYKDSAYLDVAKFISQVENSGTGESCPAGKPAWEC
ncbi:COP23 domain-containing protein [Dendronalium sp. ChiSLP03b]|uniref:COP23 domain-containing protein n=1 Tax=Dendronalium sp. ChiSLP03b TaxID=3075381 RepID=UPI00391A0DB1